MADAHGGCSSTGGPYRIGGWSIGSLVGGRGVEGRGQEQTSVVYSGGGEYL